MSVAEDPRVRLAALRYLDRSHCAADPRVFIERHVSIEDPTGAILPFRLWRSQRDALATIHAHDVTIVLKARRLGLSWLAIAYAVWLAIFQPGSRILMLCKNGDDAAEMVARARRILQRIFDDPASAHILDGYQLGADSATRVEIVTPDGRASVFRALPAKARSARLETASLVILDESAFVDDAAEVWTAVFPTIEGGGRIVEISTGNGETGQGAEYAKHWAAATTGSSGAAHVFIPYHGRPGRDEAWLERTIAAIGDEARARREYPSTPDEAFVAPDVTFAYGPAAVDAWVRLGRDLDDAIAAGDVDVVSGADLIVGLDFGEHTHALIGWPLEGGGFYVAREVVGTSDEPGAVARKVAGVATILAEAVRPTKRARVVPVADMRYDAAGVQSMRTFATTIRRDAIGERAKTTSVPFGKFKAESYAYARRLAGRARVGRTTGTLAVSPRCVELVRQLRALQSDPSSGLPVKGSDHGADALLALLAPIARRHRAAIDDLDAAA